MKESVVQSLVDIVGQENLLADNMDRFLYSYDASFPELWPEVVVFPRTTKAISRIMALASEERIPVVPRGAGTGLSGGSVPAQGGIVLCLTKMNRILNIDAGNLIADVEPGVINAHLQAAAAPYRLFYPPDPASMKVCTLGGNVAEDAGGPKCFKYGVTRNYVLGLEVVLPDGRIIETGGSVVKNTTGYDLTRLFIGSELFDSLDAASKTVSAIIAEGIIPSALEMMDNLLIRCAEDFVHVGLPTDAAAMLLIEVDGAQEALAAEAEAVERVCRREGVREIRVANTPAEADRLWLARRTVIGSAGRLRPSLVLQDVTVPPSVLPTMVARIVEVSKKYDLPIGVLAHAGDGNLHPLILFDERNPDEMRREAEAEKEIFAAALELDGTLTGEHGVGLTKLEYLPWQLKPPVIDITRGLKAVFDPQNILNPGKIVA